MKQITYARIFTLFILLAGCAGSGPDDNDARPAIGVFGGSISVRKESETAKNIWRSNLDVKVISCGVEGAGFSSRTHTENIPAQISNARPFDVYILWASGNDVVRGNLGFVGASDDNTQDGGIMKSINLARRKNRNALLLFFTSLPRFDNPLYRSRMIQFVDDQIEICNRNNIPCLDLFHLCGFDSANYSAYYLPDGIHMNAEGYRQIGHMQMEFIKESIKKHGISSNNKK
ncbi:MAG: SGNH/GDSL hydrolase family protein [Tannerellaceae bacterium]|jgi:lysophospholipase L1-like esterase|nr:SGNH/GDSL hydrolase family protein [Tannerellaceae bacterium]